MVLKLERVAVCGEQALKHRAKPGANFSSVCLAGLGRAWDSVFLTSPGAEGLTGLEAHFENPA